MTKTKDKPLLGITMGDPAGIGPEVIAKALAGTALRRLCRPIVIGSFPVMQQTVKSLKLKMNVIRVEGHEAPPPQSESSCRAGSARSSPWAVPAWSRGA